MRAIQEIAEATSPNSMRKLLSGSSRSSAGESMIFRFYRLLREGKLEEEAIVTRLYGKGVLPSEGRYKTLKSRLKRTMLDSLLNEEVMGGSYATYDKAYMTGHRQLNLARVLSIKRAYRAAAEVATSAFKNVRGYEILPVNEGLTDVLSSLYLGILHNPGLFKKYHQLHQFYTRALYDYGVVAGKYRIMRSKIYAHQESPMKIGEMALGFVEDTKFLMERYEKVPLLQAMVRTNEVMGLKMTGQYRKAIRAADEAEVALAQCKGVSSLVVSGMALMQVECALNLRDFEVGQRQVEKTRKLVPKGTINAIKLSEYAVSLGLQTGNYNYAYEVIVSLDRKTLKKLPSDKVAEFWLILEAYIRFLILAGKIDVSTNDSRLDNFRLGKFMNDVSTYAANKNGMNIQILVLQAMFFVVRGEFSKFLDRTDALDRYCNRYLKDNDNLRHNCFFRLLTEVVKGGFNLKSRRKKINTIYTRMTSVEAIEISRKTNSEIVPYEVLWDILTESISRHETTGLIATGRDLQP